MLALLWCVFCSASLSAQESRYRIALCQYGCPEGAAPENHLIVRPVYVLSYNTTYKSADWVAYSVSAGSIGIASSLSRAALEDSYVIETLTRADFDALEGTRLARSTYVPLVNFAGTPYWQDINYLTNAVARSTNLNQGAWYGLEWAVRNLVSREGVINVLAGPIYDGQAEPRHIATATAHRIPDAFFKIVFDSQGRGTAFILPQEAPVHLHHCELRTSVEEIKRQTGLRFFPDNPTLTLEPLDTSLGCF